MLNNTDSVLKKGEVEDAIQDYEALFAGARTEVRKPHSCLALACSLECPCFCEVG